MTALDTDTIDSSTTSGVDPLRIPGRKRPADVPPDTSIGPPALARAPIPASNGGPPIVRFNPTGTDLAQAGVLRPEAGPWSASNPQPLVGPDGRLVSGPAIPATATSTPPRPAPATTTAATVPSLGSPPPRPVTVAAPPLVSAGSVSNRPLGYGRTINGVRTFDNTDAAAVNAAASKINVADSGIGGNISSEAAGGTPVLGSTGVPTPTRPNPILAAQAANATAQQNAQSDAASIAAKDPRSVLGSAARNAAVDAASVGGPRGAAALASALKNLNAVPESEVANTAKLGDTAVTDTGLTNRAQLESATNLAREVIARRPEPKEINLADGTLGVLGPDGKVRPATDATGAPVRPQINMRNVDPAGYSKSLQDNLRLTLGLDPNTGLMPDPDDPKKQRAPTPQELLLASRAAKALTDEQYGTGDARPGAVPTGNVAAPQAPNQESLDFLKQHSADQQYRALFDKKYGAGAAARYLSR